MKLTFVRHHDSIGKFDPVDLPDFTVITGLNGSGKTHLMRAIEAGAIAVDSISLHEIAYYNYSDFLVPNSATLNSQQIESCRQQTWKFFNGQQGNPRINWRNNLAQIYRHNFIETRDKKQVDLLAIELPKDKSIWDAYETSSLVSSELYQKITNYIDTIKTQVFTNENFKKIPHYTGLIKALRKTNRSLNLMSEGDFKERFIPSTKSSNHLASSIGVVFTKYKVNQYLWAHQQWEASATATTKDELFNDYEKLHEKPWVVINQILSNINNFSRENSIFNFSITQPDNTRLTIENWQSYSFSPKLIDKNDGTQREFKLLSSGEQVLLALAISIYEACDDFAFPSLLLLDEIDCSLHPSMTKALLETIQSTFVQRGTKVILATHSPSTVAFAPDDSVYVVHKGRPVKKIEHSQKKDAIEFLTEGFATLEHGLSIFNEIAKHDICIITEGRNSNYIKHALKLFNQNDVEVVAGLEAVSGKDQLKTLFRLFCDAPIAKPVLFVWDCDVNFNLSDKNNAYAFILPQNAQNTLCGRGIENMFPQSFFKGFITETTDSKGNTKQKFDPKRKLDFETHVLANATTTDFEKFKTLSDKLDLIRSKITT